VAEQGDVNVEDERVDC